MRKTILLSALVAMCAAWAAHADTRLVYEGTNGHFVVSIRPGEIRIDDTGAAWQLYREETNTIYAVSPKQQSYTRMDEDVAAALHRRMAALRAEIKAQLKRLPPERRDIARAILKKQIPAFTGKPQSVSIAHTGKHDRVAGIKCEIVQVIRGGEAAERMCIASAEALGLSEGGFDTLKAMFDLMHTMLAGTGFESVSLPYLDLQGMPIRFYSPDGSARRTLVKISHEPLKDSLFTIPDSFEEQVPSKALKK